jgi:hypothetical protein
MEKMLEGFKKDGNLIANIVVTAFEGTQKNHVHFYADVQPSPLMLEIMNIDRTKAALIRALELAIDGIRNETGSSLLDKLLKKEKTVHWEQFKE